MCPTCGCVGQSAFSVTELTRPEAQSCVTCHNPGDDDGAGDVNHNISQIGDGVNRSSGVERNPPTVLGNGYRQAIGAEMTADLQGELAAATATAKSTNMAVTQALSSNLIASNPGHGDEISTARRACDAGALRFVIGGQVIV